MAMLFVWTQHHLLGSILGWFHSRRPVPVYLLWEKLEMKERLLLVLAALRIHFLSLLFSFLRVRKPEVIPRFHFRFVDLMPEMEPLFTIP
jgi:hypothetical protein